MIWLYKKDANTVRLRGKNTSKILLRQNFGIKKSQKRTFFLFVIKFFRKKIEKGHGKNIMAWMAYGHPRIAHIPVGV